MMRNKQKKIEKCLDNLKFGITKDGKLAVAYDNDGVISGRFLTVSAQETKDMLIELWDTLADAIEEMKNEMDFEFDKERIK